MTTVSFTLPNSEKLSKILSILKSFEIEYFTSDCEDEFDDLTEEDLITIKQSREEIKQGLTFTSKEVHQKMQQKYGD